MKLADAIQAIRVHGGYRVHFERRDGELLKTDYFPDNDEKPIVSEAEALALARQFAENLGPDLVVNVYLVHARDFTPVGTPRFNERGSK